MTRTAPRRDALSNEAAWLGLTYTPITAAARANLKRLWHAQKLPPVDSFDHWSMEYAREVWVMVVDCTKEESGLEHDDVLKLLDTMEVWDESPEKQQWAPK